MKTLFDSDNIEIVEIDEAKKHYPELEWDSMENLFWEIGDHVVMAVDDLLACIEIKKRGLKFDEVCFEEIEVCSVCRKVLLPDDECYIDAKTGDSLCDEHSFYSESDEAYHKKIF